jgi:predicted DNA-binding antitoxin AbrB/MazE fold protein
MIVRLVEAKYENGVLRPIEHLGLRSGERVNLLVMRRLDPHRWDLARLGSASSQEESESKRRKQHDCGRNGHLEPVADG